MPSSSIQRLFVAESKRVKCVDFHDTQPFVLCSIYDGSVTIYNYITQSIVSNIVVSSDPVRAARWIPSHHGMSWIVTASDDGFVRIFNTNTSEKVQQINVSGDYLRAITVHPTEPIFLVSGDDTLIRAYTWQSSGETSLTATFEGHGHYVMAITFNPNDPAQFASASLDNTAKVWSLKHKETLFTLTGHSKGLDCVSYCAHADLPYLATSADDHTVKIWDLNNRTCVRTLDHHTNNVSAVLFHPHLPILATGAEDGSVSLLEVPSFDSINTLSYGMNRVWSLAAPPNSSVLAIGADDGCVVLKLAKDTPVASYGTDGRVVMYKEGELALLEPKRVLRKGLTIKENQQISLEPTRSKGIDFTVDSIIHRPEGRYVAVAGSGKWSLFSSLALAPQESGKGDGFCWAVGKPGIIFGISSGSKFYVHCKQTGQKDFSTILTVSLGFVPSFVFSGPLFCACTEAFACFYDWDSGDLVQRIDVSVRGIQWNSEGTSVVIYGSDGLFLLDYLEDVAEDEDSFQVKGDLTFTSVESVVWVSRDSIIFSLTSPDFKLMYWCGEFSPTQLEKLTCSHYILGYLQDVEFYLTIDANGSIYPMTLKKDLILSFEALLHQKFELLDELVPRIKGSFAASQIAIELENLGLSEKAIELTTDVTKKLELSLKINDFDRACDLANHVDDPELFKSIGTAAMKIGKFDVAKEMLSKANDLPSLLVLGVALDDQELVNSVKSRAHEFNNFHLSFISKFVSSDVDGCLDLFVKNNLYAEASFFARTFVPSKVEECVENWRGSLWKGNPRLAESLGLPEFSQEEIVSSESEEVVKSPGDVQESPEERSSSPDLENYESPSEISDDVEERKKSD
ncbi:hypothetical protein GEMRC1_004544 [Eukaryota sp. GEM-RC1]